MIYKYTITMYPHLTFNVLNPPHKIYIYNKILCFSFIVFLRASFNEQELIMCTE